MNTDLKLSPMAQELREQLLAGANIVEAACVAEEIGRRVVEMLNGCGINVATHILAQALIARGGIQTASDWWARDIAKCPMPETFLALFDVALNLPAAISPVTYEPEKEGRPDA